MHSSELLQLSYDWLYAIKLKEQEDHFCEAFLKLSFDDLLALATNNEKKAFWINIYNAWFQKLKAANTPREVIYTASPLKFKDIAITLDEIEHGVLRKLKPHPTQQYENPSYSNKLKLLALSAEDCRIHFALNCGAASCPPIKFYTQENLDEQLEMATEAYLVQETKFLADKNELEINELFNWYLSDFGGTDGLLRLLTAHHIIPPDFKGAIRYTSFNSAVALRNFG